MFIVLQDGEYDTKTAGTDVYYYLKIDKDDPSKYKKVKRHQKVYFIVQVSNQNSLKQEISNYINFQWFRLHTTNFLTGRIVKLNCKIIPPEVMTIEGVDYNLDFAVLHYVALTMLIFTDAMINITYTMICLQIKRIIYLKVEVRMKIC